jgi:uncharacterized protein involved in outer membrane biogenesis
LAWAAAGLAVLFCLYLAAGYWLAPGLIRSQATNWVRTNLDKPVAIGEIKFDPLRFTLDIDDLAIPDRRDPLVAVGHLHVGFSVLSLFQSAYRFKDVRIDRPFLHTVMRPDGSLNLIELVPRTKSEGPSPAVRIDSFAVDQGRIVYADHSRALRPEKTLSPITFTLKDFQTNSAEGGVFSFEAKSERGESFRWSGTLSIAPVASQGKLTIANLLADSVQKFLGDELPVLLKAGTAGFDVTYNFAYGPDGARLDAAVPQLSLSGIAFDGKPNLFRGSVAFDRLSGNVSRIAFSGGNGAAPKFALTLPGLDVQGLHVSPLSDARGRAIDLAAGKLQDVRFDYAARTIALGNLSLDGAELALSRARDGRLSLMALMPEKIATPETPSPAGASAPPVQPWAIRLNSFELNAATLRFEDRAVSPMARFTLTPIDVAASGVSSDLNQPVSLRFSTRIDKRAALEGEGTVIPAGNKADLTVKLSGLPLKAFIAYLPPIPDLELKSGTLGGSGTLHAEGSDLTRLRFKGRAAVDRFDLYEKTANTSLVAWRALTLEGVDYGASRLAISRARLNRPLGRLAVLPDRTFNYMKFLPQPAAGTPADGAAASAAPAAVVTPRPRAAAPAMTFALKRLDVDGGTMSFADYSMDPNFEARIDALKGSITNISSRPGEIATIDFTGQVIDRFSPVTIKGSMDPFGYDQQTALQLAFHNIELPVFNPYSGRYAGYAIAKGKLSTELTYHIDHRALKADHHIVIDQLEWGQATDSKEKVPLPVRLATALLKDRNGVIDLNLPVVGSLDDPKFRIWPIVWQIIGNVIEKAVTAPFQLIGSLFAGAEKAQFVDFTPGASALPPGSAEALGAFAKALVERPAISLDIPAGPATPADAAGMADNRIDAALMEKETKKGAPADIASLSLDDRHDRLEDLYNAKLGKDPEFPEFPPEALKAGANATPARDEDDQKTFLEAEWMRAQLRPAFAPSQAELAALGLARATAVRDALLSGQTIDPGRVFLATALTATTTDGHSRLELKLK